MSQIPIPETIGYLLAQVCKLRRARGGAKLERIGLYCGQHFVLCCLWKNEGMTHSELAEQLRVRPATITNGLQRMEKAGLVERRPDSKDQRVSRVYLTGAGREIRGAVEQVWEELENQTFAGFGPEERAQLYGLLLRICHNLER